MPHPLTSQDAPLTQSTYSPSTFGVGVGADDGLNRAEPPIRRADGDRVHHSDDPSAAPDILFQSSAEVSDARPEIRQLTTCSTPASNDLNGIDAHEFIHAADGVSMGSLFDDASDWWNLTFAEAGFPHLEGLEPANNFRGL
uniref:Uncharacterized protein n=1 Tax=Bionectria ochroleuca TaxID=29856 RepID=A0A8H7K657_BIOOC